MNINQVWIPCSHRLPLSNSIYDKYLVTIKGTKEMIVASYDPRDGQWYEDDDAVDVVAWQPLPEPYKERRRKK